MAYFSAPPSNGDIPTKPQKLAFVGVMILPPETAERDLAIETGQQILSQADALQIYVRLPRLHTTCLKVKTILNWR